MSFHKISAFEMAGRCFRSLTALSVAFGALVSGSDTESLANVPSVKLHVTSKRPSLQIHGQTEFDVFANPIVSGDRVLYDGFATFKDGTTYSYVNGTGYLSTIDGNVQCIPLTTLPFNAILPALNAASHIPSASIGDELIDCESGKLLRTTFAGVDFAICSSGASGFTAYSSDFTIEAEYLENPVVIPRTSGASCRAVATATSVTPTALALMTGTSIPTTSRQLKTAEHMEMEASSCKCKTTPRPCIFFHGIGNANELEELANNPKKASGRMGNMNKHSPCCSTVKYAILNTMDYGWNNDTLQEKFCDRALRLTDISDVKKKTITDTVIITHSMAGLVMSMAIATGKCSFGEGSTWVAISSPMTGSMASDYFQDFCSGETNNLATKLVNFFGQCPMPIARQSITYENGKYSSKKLNAAYVKAQKAYAENVDAAMCSDNPSGVLSEYKPIFLLTAELVDHQSPENDGLVEFQSCAKGLDKSKFGKSYKDIFYRPELNHADTAFLTSDGWFKDSQKPHKWFECLL